MTTAKMSKEQFVAYLCREARTAVLSHRQDAADHPDRHRGCLWCEDGRLSHWLDDLEGFYRDDELVKAVDRLYRRAYGPGYDGIM